MYDVTGWTNMQTEIKADWTSKMSAHTASRPTRSRTASRWCASGASASTTANHPWDAATCLDVVNWFKSQGCYVIGGVPREWRTGTGGSRAGYLGVYHAFNMLSPWMVGAIGTAADSDTVYTNYNVPDQADCNANGIDYQPCVLPGDVSANQRAHGDFMWRAVLQHGPRRRAGHLHLHVRRVRRGQPDRQDGRDQAGVPAGSGLLSLDQDGTACSSDYYLRLTNDGGRMLKGQIALTATRPTQPTLSSATTVISLRSRANNMYVTADNAGASPLIANRTAIGTWEQFDQITAGSGTIALRAHANNMYVTADNAGASPLIANRTAIGTWETFQLIQNPGGTVSLLALADNMYVTAENAGASPLIANRTAIGTWEQFDLITG